MMRWLTHSGRWRVGACVIAVLWTLSAVTLPSSRVDATASSPLLIGATPQSSEADSDDDGIADTVEATVGTDPSNPDTDGDGIRDGGDPDIVATVVRTTSPTAFRTAGNRTALLARLDDAEAMILAGDIAGATDALVALRRRLDGCPPAAQRDDWIVRCTAQLAVRSILDLVIQNRFSFSVDPDLTPPVATVPGLRGGPDRPVALASAPDGQVESFVADEIVLRPPSEGDLQAFLSTYGGTVLEDGTPVVLPGSVPDPGLPPTTGWYLVHVDPSRSALGDLAATMESGGLRGHWTFSSEDATRLMALVGREGAIGARPNFLMDTDQRVVRDHPTATGFVDAAKWWWMSEDSDPATPGDQGLSIGVVHAWDYLRYKGYPPIGTPYPPIRLAVIDGGFDLDETTGLGNADYVPNPPLQIDRIAGDFTAGGPGYGFANCNGCWHGQMTFGVAAARPDNQFGSAGTSGGEARPILIKISADFATIAKGVNDAVYNDARVISMSISGNCGYICRHYQGGDELKDAVNVARVQNRIVVSSAGNEGEDISDDDRYPCELNGVVCVGAIGPDAKALGSNWGTPVDVFAPTCIRTTITRDSAAEDPDNIDEDELAYFCGTSASAPFTSGVVALMKMLDPGLTYDQVRPILWSTANGSTDPKVAPVGYIDAYRALNAVKPNLPPTVSFTDPEAATVAYHDVDLRADVSDPEWSGAYKAEFPVKLSFTSSLDGPLCSASGTATSLGCTVPLLSLGTHVVSATVTDAFGATATATRTITVVNQPPTVDITYPPTLSTFWSSQSVNLRGSSYDPDETIPDSALLWRTDGGPLATGSDVWVTLPPGAHTITLTASDSLGATGSDQITVAVYEGAGYPTVKILQPAVPANVSLGSTTTFHATALDPEEGDISSEIVWTSSLDGYLGTGTTIQATLSGATCNSILHTITATVTDDDGHSGSHSIPVAVINLC